jgi:hypothetical protein
MGKKSLVFFFPNPCAGIRQTLSSQRNSVVYKKGQYLIRYSGLFSGLLQ